MVYPTKIIGTHLWTGIWYTIDNKANYGRLTFEDKKIENGYHVKSEYNSKNHKEGGDNWGDAQWMIISTEKPDHYMLKVKSKGDRVLAYEGEARAGYKWGALVGYTAEYQPGGDSRSNALWMLTPEKNEHSTTYQLKNAKYPDSGALTWTAVGEYYSIVPTTKGEGARTDASYLWKFENIDPVPTAPTIKIPNYQVVGKIPGTSLWTGLWYTVDNRADYGRLTIEDKKINNGYHVKSAYNFKDHKEGGDKWEEAQWMIIPTDKEDQYMLRIKAKADRVLAFEGEARAGYMWGALMGYTYDYLPSGESRTEALWKFLPEKDEHSNSYQLKNAKYPESGALTWTAVGKYYSILPKTPGEGARTDKSYLWKFENVDPIPTSPTLPIPDNQPKTKIPGTNLWTGLWYTVDNKADYGRLTIDEKKIDTGTGYHVKSLYNSNEHKEGGYKWDEAQWMIIPTEVSEKYLLRLRAKGDRVLAFECEARAGYMWGALMSHNADYQSGGQSRTDALWKLLPEKDEDSDSYQLKNAKYPESGALTWTAVGKYNSIVPKTPGEGARNDKSYLWKFTPLDPIPTSSSSEVTPDQATSEQYQYVYPETTYVYDDPVIIYVQDPDVHIYK